MGINFITSPAGRMPALQKAKSPGVAAVVGFVFGGVGLGTYLGSFVDFVIPIVIVVLSSATLQLAG